MEFQLVCWYCAVSLVCSMPVLRELERRQGNIDSIFSKHRNIPGGKRNLPKRTLLELFSYVQRTNLLDDSTEIRLIKPSVESKGRQLQFDVPSHHNITRIQLAFTLPNTTGSTGLSISIDDTAPIPSKFKNLITYDVTGALRRQSLRTSVINVNVSLVTENESHSSEKFKIRHLMPTLVLFENVSSASLESLWNTDRKRRSANNNSRPERTASRALISRRFTTTTNSLQRQQLCRLAPWRVDFNVMGWNFILAPATYQANMCIGNCPVPLSERYFNTTNYAYIKNMYRHSPAIDMNSLPPACCVPVNYAPLSVLLEDQGGAGTVIRRYERMVVTACGCR